MKLYITIVILIISLSVWILLWEKPQINNWNIWIEKSESEEKSMKLSVNEIELTTQEILVKLELPKDQNQLDTQNIISSNQQQKLIPIEVENLVTCEVKDDILSELDSLLSSEESDNKQQKCIPIKHVDTWGKDIMIDINQKVIPLAKKENIISNEVKIEIKQHVPLIDDTVWKQSYDTLSNGNISDEWEYIFHYIPQQEWFIPNGNIEDFSLSHTWVVHAYWKNYKHIYLTLKNISMNNGDPLFEDIVGLLHKYTDKQIYFLNDEQEGNLYWDIHVNFNSIDESEKLLHKLSQDKYVLSVNYQDEIMPIFLKDKEKIENFKTESEFQILQQLQKWINHIPIDQDQEDELATIILQPDFQPHEYFRNSEDEAPQVYRYKPKPEWLIPEGSPGEFSLDKRKISNAYWVNFKHIAFSIKNEYIETEIGTLDGMTKFLRQYISQDFYFVGDNEEESSYRTIHVNVSSYSESQELMKQLRFDPKIWTIRNRSYLLPEFQHMEKEINDKHDEYSIFTIEKLIE